MIQVERELEKEAVRSERSRGSTVDGGGEAPAPTRRRRGSRVARETVERDQVRRGGAPSRGSELSEVEALKTRIKQLEGHRDQWRRHAYHLADLIREKNFDAAAEVVAEWDENSEEPK